MLKKSRDRIFHAFIHSEHHESWTINILLHFSTEFYVNKNYFIWKAIREMLTFILCSIDDDVLIFQLFTRRTFR